MMKAKYIFPILALFFLASCASKGPYVSDDALSMAGQHREVAILPFAVSFDNNYKMMMRQARGRNGDEYWAEQGRLAGLEIQKDFFTVMAKEIEKGRIQKVIQSFAVTNKRLSDAGIPIQQLQNMDKAQLCQILGVDAVLVGTSKVEVFPGGRFSSPGGTRVEARLYDGRSGALIWSDETLQRPSTPYDTPSRLGSMAVDGLVKDLPYRKKRG
ncbi:hypothetical protein LAG90_09750 [Marinilongibacter aquaticus]|uniref:hypothetical protein n=1 Tax=Marinilongibacter aquaticus TaxID=2975157 RepID=UPI0021BD6E2C|nr:hypothetical protein [Marinilongibacter aquaticus]UBM60916.1 hypothetical protein LAG90_09750 [Marinilongibacter aquaticus]